MAQIKADEISQLIREQIENYESKITVDEVGTVHRSAAQPYSDTAYNLFDLMERQATDRDFAAAIATLDALLAEINQPTNVIGLHLKGALQAGDYPTIVNDVNLWRPHFRRACDNSSTTAWNSSSFASTTQRSGVLHFPQRGTPLATAGTRFLAPQLSHTTFVEFRTVAVTRLPAPLTGCSWRSP